jgi:SAM-dependent methyltransferase
MADHLLSAVAPDRRPAWTEAGWDGDRFCLLASAAGRVLDLGGGFVRHLARPPAGAVTGAVTGVVVLLADGEGREAAGGGRPTLGAVAVPCERDRRPFAASEFADGSFDTIVSTFALCTVADLDGAARRIRRWLADDGRVLFLEPVVGIGWWAAARRVAAERAAGPAPSHRSGGCRLDRDVLAALRRAGLFVGRCERFSLPVAGSLRADCVEGVARPRRGHPRTDPPSPS